MLQLVSPRPSTRSKHHRSIDTPLAISSGVAEAPRAQDKSVQGLLACTCKSGAGGGRSTWSPPLPSVARHAVPPDTLALQSLRGTGSESTPRITSAPASSAPAEKPPLGKKTHTDNA
eukprot:7389844-Prymnesium_polylepis.2